MSNTTFSGLQRFEGNTPRHVSGSPTTKPAVRGVSRHNTMAGRDSKTSSLTSCNVQRAHRGIYLRPTVFMINGTATHLMEVLYPSITTAATTTTTNTASLSEEEEALKWWGYLRPDTPRSWVSFDYTICTAAPSRVYMDATCPSNLASEDYTEEEMIGNSLSPEPDPWWLAAAAQLSESLRENRLSALFKAEVYNRIDRHLQLTQGHISAFLRGGGDGLTPKDTLLLSGVEVALRAMLPGEEYGFLIMAPCSSSQSPSYVTYHDEFMNTHKKYYSGMRFFYIHIKLLMCLLREPVFPPIVEKYIVSLPPCSGESHVGNDATELERAYSTCASFFCFFRASLLFYGSSRGPAADATTLRNARRALFVAITSASVNCHSMGRQPPLMLLRNGHPSATLARLHDAIPHRLNVFVDGKPDPTSGNERDGDGVSRARVDNVRSSEVTMDDRDSPTDEDALMFLRTRFFSVPRDGATVSCSVTRISPLTMCPLPVRKISGVLLGSMALPLWLDTVLQTMHRGEEDVIGIHLSSEDDGAFHCTLVEELRVEAVVQLQAVESTPINPGMREREEEEEEDEEKDEAGAQREQQQQQQQQQQTTEGGPLFSEPNSFLNKLPASPFHGSKGGIVGSGVSVPHDLSCRVVLEEFRNVYDTDAFFFVNPEVSLRTVLQLQDGVNLLLVSRGRQQSGPHAEEAAESMDGGLDDASRLVREEVINIMPTSFGCINYYASERHIVKAIHKLNFAVLLLTFQVDMSRMLERGLSPALVQQYQEVLAHTFFMLGCSYTKLNHETAHTLAIEACSASIAVFPYDYRSWICRGSLLQCARHYDDALHDFLMVKSLLESKLQQCDSSSHEATVTDGGGGGGGGGSSGAAGVQEDASAVRVQSVHYGFSGAPEEAAQLQQMLLEISNVIQELQCGK